MAKMKRAKGQRTELREGAEDLKARRERMGKTQAQLAADLAVERNTVARWETAQREIPLMALKLLDYIEREARGKPRKER